MTAEIDRRDEQSLLLTAQRQSELRSRAAELLQLSPALDVRIDGFDERTGNPNRVRVSEPPPGRGPSVERALEGLRLIAPVLGLASRQPVEFSAQPQLAMTSAGAAAVNVQQQYKGIPIFGADATVRFAPNGSLTDVLGTTVTVEGDLPAAPAFPVEAAAERAVEHLIRSEPRESAKTDQFGQPMQDIPVSEGEFTPKVLATFSSLPARPTVFEPGPFDEVKASLVWFPLGEDLRLGWELSIRLPRGGRAFTCVVDATTAEVLFAKLAP